MIREVDYLFVRYQPHIDGLRAVAIIPVLLFHLGVSGMPGGFIGVDVFFVISGYLITNVLINEFETGKFSIARFYQRRVLRIFPALLVMLLIVGVVSTWIYFPTELQSIGLQLVAAAAFVSNFYFWRDSGYFSAAAEAQPLLHTWSLAVEEQFYIVFPVILYLLYRFARKHLAAVLIALVIVSLGTSIAFTYIHQPTAFYLLPTRAWELGAGALLSVFGAKKFDRSAGSNWVSLFGLALIIVPVLSYESGAPPFPGWAAIPPVLGSALLIGWAERTLIGGALAWRPIAYIGKISFSVYLWHWPLIVFYKAVYGPQLNGWEMVGLGLASIIFGSISTEFIEKPFRTNRARSFSSRRVLAVGVASLIVVASLGTLQNVRPVSAFAASPQALKIAEVAEYRGTVDHENQFRSGTCLIGQSDQGTNDFVESECADISSDRLNVLVLGDSHAAQFFLALSELHPNANFLQVTASGCRPLLNSTGTEGCTDLRDWAFSKLLSSGKIDVVVLGGRWKMDEMEYVHPTIEYLQRFTNQVLVLGPTVEYEGVFPTLLARGLVNGSDFDFQEYRTPGRDEVDNSMHIVTEDAGATYISVLKTICSSENDCTPYAKDGYPMQFDYGHLTLSGSRYVVEAHHQIFADAFSGE